MITCLFFFFFLLLSSLFLFFKSLSLRKTVLSLTNMFEDSGYFDPSQVIQDNYNDGAVLMEDNIQIDIADASGLNLDHLGFDMHEDVNIAPTMDATNWEPQINQQYSQTYGPAPDLLNLMQVPTYHHQTDMGPMFYDPAMNMGYNAGPQAGPDLLRDLYQSLPQSYGLFCGVEERENNNGIFQEMQFVDGGVIDYRGVEISNNLGKGEVKGNFCTEKHRREQLNEKYKTLKSLVPTSTKGDRASIVGDAIEYIKTLLQNLEELKTQVEKKKHGITRQIVKAEDIDVVGDVESSSIKPMQDNGSLRCSWIQKKSKISTVDVRVIDNEVNIKLTQMRKSNCLLYVAKMLEEFQLDTVHASGGNIGESCVYMINAKMREGSSVYAGAIAKKLLEVMDRQLPALTLPACY